MHPKFLEIEGQPFDHRSLNCDGLKNLKKMCRLTTTHISSQGCAGDHNHIQVLFD